MSERTTESADWCARCALRVRDLDPQLSDGEALDIAREFSEFERTAKMEPEAAADFVHNEMGGPELPRFERRIGNRADRTAISRFL